MVSQIATLRSNADQQIGTDVDAVNKDLATLKGLDAQITSADRGPVKINQPIIKDKRNSALQDITSYIWT